MAMGSMRTPCRPCDPHRGIRAWRRPDTRFPEPCRIDGQHLRVTGAWLRIQTKAERKCKQKNLKIIRALLIRSRNGDGGPGRSV